MADSSKSQLAQLLGYMLQRPVLLGLAVLACIPAGTLMLFCLPVVLMVAGMYFITPKVGAAADPAETPIAEPKPSGQQQNGVGSSSHPMPEAASYHEPAQDPSPIPTVNSVSPEVDAAQVAVEIAGGAALLAEMRAARAKPAPTPEQSGSLNASIARSEPSEVEAKPPLEATAAEAAPPALTGGAALLAKMRAARSKPAPGGKTVVVLYASQTGTAQEIAKSFAAEASASGINAKASSFNEFGFENLTLSKAPIVIIMASSTGDGDPPDNAAKFLVSLKRKSHPSGMLSGIRYTCLGLGDSNYTRFCAVPKAFVRRFEDLGAVNFYPNIEVDEVDGIEQSVEQWCSGLHPRLAEIAQDREESNDISPTIREKLPSSTPTDLVGVPALSSCSIKLAWETDNAVAVATAAAERQHPTSAELLERDAAGLYSAERPFWGQVTLCYNLCAPFSDRKVLQLEIDVSGSGMNFQPGDAIGVRPKNSCNLVEGLLSRLGVDGDCVFSVLNSDGSSSTKLPHLGWPCTVKKALSEGCDLTGVPKKSLLRMLAEYCQDPDDKHKLLYLCSRGGRDEYKVDISDGQPSLLDLLDRFRSCQPPLDHLLEALPPLTPRMYSLCNSPLRHPNSVHVAFSVVKYTTARYGEHDGVATSWLSSVCLDPNGNCSSPKIPVFLRPNQSFRPPSDLSAPLIMIGPGTGVAPFRGFLQERSAKATGGADLGVSWLFFGCRRPDEDYLYREELEGFAASGILTHLEVAFSREHASKIYVQDRMKARGQELCHSISAPNSFIMVCGDGAHMAKDVHQCLIDIMVKHGNMTEPDATSMLATMTKDRRYIRDIWS